MSTVQHRPYTDAERRTLNSLASGSADWGADAANAGCLFAVLMTVGFLLIAWLGLPRARWQPVTTAVAVIAAFAFGLYLRRQSRSPARTTRYVEDLARGQAEVATYEVTDAIRIAETEDEGSNYAVQLADGQVLYLSGQYLYDPEEASRFPCTQLVLSRAPVSRTVLDIQCGGRYFPPSSRLASLPAAHWPRGSPPEDGDVLRVDFEALRN